MEKQDEGKDKMQLLDLERIKECHPLLKVLVESGLITEQGIPQYGGGIRIKLLEEIKQLLDKNNKRLWVVSQQLDKIGTKLGANMSQER